MSSKDLKFKAELFCKLATMKLAQSAPVQKLDPQYSELIDRNLRSARYLVKTFSSGKYDVATFPFSADEKTKIPQLTVNLAKGALYLIKVDSADPRINEIAEILPTMKSMFSKILPYDVVVTVGKVEVAYNQMRNDSVQGNAVPDPSPLTVAPGSDVKIQNTMPGSTQVNPRRAL